MPFVTSVDKFEKTIKDVKNDKKLSKKQKDYIELKLKTKKMWSKCFLKTNFIGGVSTTSRVEALHAKQKKVWNSTSGLQKVFHSFRAIEKTEITKFKEEYLRHGKELVDQDIISLAELKKEFSFYVYKKIYPKFCKGLNYKHELIGTNSW